MVIQSPPGRNPTRAHSCGAGLNQCSPRADSVRSALWAQARWSCEEWFAVGDVVRRGARARATSGLEGQRSPSSSPRVSASLSCVGDRSRSSGQAIATTRIARITADTLGGSSTGCSRRRRVRRRSNWSRVRKALSSEDALFPRTRLAHSGGARAGNRTLNLGLKRPLLCQLSYASALPEGIAVRF